MQTASTGTLVPDLEFLTPRGEPLRLSDIRADALVVIFLRHLA